MSKSRGKKTVEAEPDANAIAIRDSNKAIKLISDFGSPTFLAMGLLSLLTKTVGAANFAFPPRFSVGYWFDDLFGGISIICAFFFVWAAESIRDPSERRTCMYVGFLCSLVGVVASFAFDRISLVYTVIFALMVGVFFQAIRLSAKAPPTTQPPIRGSQTIVRAVILANAAFFVAAGAARLIFGIDKGSALPPQPQVRLAAPFAIAVGLASFFAALAKNDLNFMRAALHAGLFATLFGSGWLGNGSLRKEALASFVQWAITGLLAANVYAYQQPEISARLRKSIRSAIGYVRGLPENVSEGFGDE